MYMEIESQETWYPHKARYSTIQSLSMTVGGAKDSMGFCG